MTTLVINSLQNNPVRIALTINGQGYTLEYPDKADVLGSIADMPPEPGMQLETAFLMVLHKWQETDPQLSNLAGLKDKTCTISSPIVSIV